ncbi:MAG: phosphoenolpyruvate synthase, partial [Rikenellaceae bacterium]
RKELKTEVEIEFALNMDVKPGKAAEFKFLQIRPIVKESQKETIKWEAEDVTDSIIYATSAMGLGRILGLRDIVYVKTDAFNPAKTEVIARELTELNEVFQEKGKNFILIGPGRWGSSDPWLGVPIKWSQISQARVICESGLPNFLIEPSQGTHFFQNLTSFGVGYMTLNPCQGNGIYDTDFLDEQEATFETEYIRHVTFRHPLYVFIDGLNNKGIVRYVASRKDQE